VTARSRFARCLAELAGTAILVAVGTGAIVGGARAGFGSPWFLPVAWFVAVAVPIALFSRVSGAHLNPAVTLGLAVAGRCAPGDVAPYIASQTVGAFAGSAAVLLLLGGGVHLGATVPRGGDVVRVLPLEFAATAVLVLAVLYGTVRPRYGAGFVLAPLVVGLATWQIGPWTGCSLNPARTLAPAVLSGDHLGLWAYLLAVPAGALAAALLGRYAFRSLGSGGPETASVPTARPRDPVVGREFPPATRE
jgi:glycerol uptake facilitator-like aquaporin